MAYYVFDEKLCKAEGMTKEQIINAIAQATGVTPADVDEGFISTIVENNRSRSIHIWKGTRAEFNALASKSSNVLYIIDDDTTISDFEAHLDEVDDAISELNDAIDALKTYHHNLTVTIFNVGSEPMVQAYFSFPTTSSAPLTSLADVASAFDSTEWSGSFSIPCTGAYNNTGTYEQLCEIEDSGTTYAFIAYVLNNGELSRDVAATFDGNHFAVSVTDTVIAL